MSGKHAEIRLRKSTYTEEEAAVWLQQVCRVLVDEDVNFEVTWIDNPHTVDTSPWGTT